LRSSMQFPYSPFGLTQSGSPTAETDNRSTYYFVILHL
jgi:hypothetical protein